MHTQSALRYCPSCGSPADAEWTFCNRCGARLPDETFGNVYLPPSAGRWGASQDEPDLVLASFGKRFLALLIDLVLAGFLGGVIYFVALVFLGRGLAFGLNFAFSTLYYTIGNGMGGTWGASLAGVRVVNADGEPPGMVAGFVRYLFALLSGLVLLLGYLWAAWDRRSQTWHDMAAGTYVIEAPRPTRAQLR